MKTENGKLRADERLYHTPSPLGLPRSQRESQLQQKNVPNFVHLRQGTKKIPIRMAKCHFVPSEGRNPHCDVGTSEAEWV